VESSCGGGRAPLLEALATVNRTPLSGLERYSRFLAALGTDCRGLHALETVAACRLVALRFAGLAPLGFVSEALVGVKELFASGKYEFRPAVDALQDPILVFHASPPLVEPAQPAVGRWPLQTT